MIHEKTVWERALEPFSEKARATVRNDEILCLLSPTVFMRLAAPISSRIDSSGRTRTIRKALDGKIGLGSLPCLELTTEDARAWVTGHDGRHRAMELRDRGHALIPVLLCFEECESHEFERVETLHPEAGDDEETYPGFDGEHLEERMRPIRMDSLTGLMIRTPRWSGDACGS